MASSSSAAPAASGAASSSGAGADPPPVAAASVCELSPAPHRGDLFLDDMPDGSQVLTHRVTLERVELPAGPVRWSLVFGDDGFAALVTDEDPPRVELAEDKLKFHVYTNSAGDLFFVTGACLPSDVVHLRSFKEKWVEVSLTMPWGASGATHTLTAVMFRWHRYGSRVFVSMTSLYNELGLTQFNGQPWRWTQGCKRWDAWLAGIGLPEQIAYSNLVLACMAVVSVFVHTSHDMCRIVRLAFGLPL